MRRIWRHARSGGGGGRHARTRVQKQRLFFSTFSSCPREFEDLKHRPSWSSCEGSLRDLILTISTYRLAKNFLVGCVFSLPRAGESRHLGPTYLSTSQTVAQKVVRLVRNSNPNFRKATSGSTSSSSGSSASLT